MQQQASIKNNLYFIFVFQVSLRDHNKQVFWKMKIKKKIARDREYAGEGRIIIKHDSSIIRTTNTALLSSSLEVFFFFFFFFSFLLMAKIYDLFEHFIVTLFLAHFWNV